MQGMQGEGNGNPPQYSCLEKSMDRGTWQATVHGVAKSQTRLNDLAQHTSPSQALEFTPFHQGLDFDVTALPGLSSPFLVFFCCAGSMLPCRLSLVAGSGGHSLVAVLGLLIAVASLVELRL